MSATEYLESLLGKLPALYTSEEQLRTLRADPKTREELLKQLADIGLDKEQFATLQNMFDAPESDLFDILTHLSYGDDMKTKTERVHRVLENGIIQQINNLTAQQFIEYLLAYYEKYGSTELVQSKLSSLIDLYGGGTINVVDFTKQF